MSATTDTIEFGEVGNEAVWESTRILFLAALGFFLVNIALGFLNALTVGLIAHWQIVTNLHSAALGWITLSVLGLAIWVFTGGRSVADDYVNGIRLLAYLGILAVLLYVASFALVYNRGGELMILVPIVGSGVLLIFWAATIYVFRELRR